MNRSLDQSILRTIDANLDRAEEGLRVVGEIVRFIVDDQDLTAQIRNLRRSLISTVESIPNLRFRALNARDSRNDVGQSFTSSPYRDVQVLIQANWSRVQESIRTLEELFRVYIPTVAQSLVPFRYESYTLEQITVNKVAKFSLHEKLNFGLYVVLGQAQQRGRDFVEVTRAAIAGGAGAIQLRAKELGKRELLTWAYRLREITFESGVTFIVNDHLDVAMACGADGVHLGQNDLPIPEARAIVGPHFILGASTHSLEEAKQAEAQGANYINVGPIFPTQTKVGAHPPVGPALFATVREAVNTPLTCMGGINHQNIDQLLALGAKRIAVVSAVVGADDIEAAARELSNKIASS